MIYTYKEAAYAGARRGTVHRCPLPGCDHPSASEWNSGIDSIFCVEHQSVVTITPRELPVDYARLPTREPDWFEKLIGR